MRSFPKGVRRLHLTPPASGVCVVLPQLPAHRGVKQPPPFPLFFLTCNRISFHNYNIRSFRNLGFLFRQHNSFYLLVIQENSDHVSSTQCSLPRRWLYHCLMFEDLLVDYFDVTTLCTDLYDLYMQFSKLSCRIQK